MEHYTLTKTFVFVGKIDIYVQMGTQARTHTGSLRLTAMMGNILANCGNVSHTESGEKRGVGFGEYFSKSESRDRTRL